MGGGLPGARAPASSHALVFFAAGSAYGRAGFMVVAARRGRGGVGNIVLILALVIDFVGHLVDLLEGRIYLCLTLAVSSAVAADFTGGAI